MFLFLLSSVLPFATGTTNAFLLYFFLELHNNSTPQAKS